MAMKPGERRLQILQTLATMLEHPRCEKVTTAALAARLDVSEAALRQSLRIAQAANGWHGDASADAAVLISYVIGRWQLFAKTGFKRVPQESWDLQRKFLFG